MPDYAFYVEEYGGRPSGEACFAGLVKQAEAQVARYERDYTVAYPQADGREKAVCAVLEQMLLTHEAQGEAGSTAPAEGRLRQVAVGSVRGSYEVASADGMLESEAARYYNAARLYADIYRGRYAEGKRL